MEMKRALKFWIALTMVCLFSKLALSLPIDIDEIRTMYQKSFIYWPKPHIDKEVNYEELQALPKNPPFPPENPYTQEKASLGEMLFNDPKLSLSHQIACASCHEKDLGYADGRRVSFGHNRLTGTRNAPSLIMAVFGQEKFWDGRAKSLEDQVLFPIIDPKEMAFNFPDLLKRLNEDKVYVNKFQKVFHHLPITLKQITQAIATYERTLMPKTSKFDRFLRGNHKAMNDEEIWGMHLFRTKARCINCHYGAALSDQKYHNLGLSFYGRNKQDLGRYEISKKPKDVGAFKTPSLRGVVRTAPYMHMGTFPTLRGVINAYNAGMPHFDLTQEQINDPYYPKTDPLLQELHLTPEEIKALEAFLKAI